MKKAGEKELADYIRKQLKAGYTLSQLKQALSGQGYGKELLQRAAVKAIEKKPIDYRQIAIYGIPSVLVILAILFLTMMFVNMSSSLALSFNAGVYNDILFADDRLIVDVTITNAESTAPEEIMIILSVPQTAIQKTVSTTIEGEGTERIIMDIPRSLQEGEYTLQADIIHDSFEASKSLPIYINKPKDHFEQNNGTAQPSTSTNMTTTTDINDTDSTINTTQSTNNSTNTSQNDTLL